MVKMLGDYLMMVDAAKLIGMSQPALSGHVKRGHIPVTRIGRQVLILRKDALAFKKKDRYPGRPKKKN